MPIRMQYGIDGAKEAGGSAVIIDVCRASSTIATALYKGASSVIPVGERSHAIEYRARHPQFLFASDDEELIAQGFLDNSPLQIYDMSLHGRKLVLLSANGTRAIASSRKAKEVLVGSFLNAVAIARYLERHDDVTLVPVGDTSGVTTEDDLCAQYIKGILEGRELDRDEIRRTIMESPSVEYLRTTGRGDDLDFCLRFNSFAVVPRLANEEIVNAA